MRFMENNHNKPSIRDRVADDIQSGRVVMKPKWRFVLHAALMATGSILVLLILLYLVSFFIFILHQTGIWFAPSFGSHGWAELFVSLPWMLVIVALIFILILELLSRRYAFGYRQPLLLLAAMIIFIALIGGGLIARTPLHQFLFESAEEYEWPVIDQLYRTYGLRRLNAIHVGTVLTITDDGFILRNPRNEDLYVTVYPETRFPAGTDFQEGDAVTVFGNRDENTITAYGIRKVDEHFGPMMMPWSGTKIRRPFRMPMPH